MMFEQLREDEDWDGDEEFIGVDNEEFYDYFNGDGIFQVIYDKYLGFSWY
jgi:hypothetical protein